jgi:AraC-like DNA-binding protein
MGRSQLHNKIKALTGHSASHFIKETQLCRDGQFLQTSEINIISLVVFEVGTESLSYLPISS